jgi:hypothetical protein
MVLNAITVSKRDYNHNNEITLFRYQSDLLHGELDQRLETQRHCHTQRLCECRLGHGLIENLAILLTGQTPLACIQVNVFWDVIRGLIYLRNPSGMAHGQSHLHRGGQLWSGPDQQGTRLYTFLVKDLDHRSATLPL